MTRNWRLADTGLIIAGQAAVAAIGVSKTFGGIRAVVDVTFSAQAGRITGLIGPNGAGKSTLLSLLGGADRPDSGRIELAGIDVTRWPDRRRARAGLIRTFQVSRPLGHMTVLENLLIGSMNVTGESFSSAIFRRKRWLAAEAVDLERAWNLCDRFNLKRVANDFAETLSGGQLRLLELARALMAEPKVLLLDEPFAGVNPTLARELADHVTTLRTDQRAIVLIEHDLNLMGQLCDPIVVMEAGSVLATGTMDELSRNEAVVRAYLGQRPTAASNGGR